MAQDLLSYKPLVDRYLKLSSPELSSHSFVNIFIWQDFFKFDFEEIDGNLCIFASDDLGTFLYLPPLGKKISSEAVQECFTRMTKDNKGQGITRIDNVPENLVEGFSKSGYKVLAKGHEYLYKRKDLVELKGNSLKSKRNAYNHFVKHHKADYQPYGPSMLKPCLELYQRWARRKKESSQDEVYLQMVEENAKVHRRTLESCRDLDLIGRAVKIDGKIVAYTFGHFVNSKIFCDLMEIADTDYKGLSTYIFSEFCDDPDVAPAEWINAMDDFAMDNVARTKMSYRPSRMIPVYTVSLK